MVAAYIGLSRAKLKEKLSVVQPFSPGLFAHGSPPGPSILLKLLRGDIRTDQVDQDFGHKVAQ